MKTSLLTLAMVATVAATLAFFSVDRASPAQPRAVAHAEGTKLLARLPAVFVPNRGQWDHRALFVTRVGAMTVFLEEHGWTFTLVERAAEKEKGANETDRASARGVAVRMTFAGARTRELTAEEQLSGRHNYFLGNDPSRWRGDVPLYRSVRYREVHPGIDVRAREGDGHFEYDLLLQPGAELDSIEIAVEGIERMHLDAAGGLVLETRVGPVRMPAPPTWEEGPAGEKSPVTCRYVVRGADRFGFEAPGRRSDWALVVDPGLVWSTFLGGADDDQATAVALDAQGGVTVAGHTTSPNFPTTPGAFDTTYNGARLFDYPGDAFVTRLSPTGSSLVFSTFVGGAGNDQTNALALDAQGGVTIAGATDSADFPTTPGAWDRTYNGAGDAFVTRLSPTGATLTWSTFLGGIFGDYAEALALDGQGAVTVTGYTVSSGFPTTPGAFDTSHNGERHGDAFVTRLSPAGSSLVYSTFLGGVVQENTRGVALDAQGAATIVGYTNSSDFPTTSGAFATIHNGGIDIFVTRLSPAGSSLVYSTFLGGADVDDPAALAVDPQGAVTVAGFTTSTNFPTTPGAFDRSHNGLHDGFVTRLSPAGSSLVYSTFFGGGSDDGVVALVVDTQGGATVGGITRSSDLPTTPGAFDASYNGDTDFDGFVARLSPTGSSLVYSTLLGEPRAQDRVAALALDAQGAATVAGNTSSRSFPTTPGAFDTTPNGLTDVFVTRLDLLPTGVAAFGRSSPGCAGPLPISVTSMPRLGNVSFSLTCGNAPPNATGMLTLTGNRLPSPVIVLGVEVWSDYFNRPFLPLPASSNQLGASERLLPIPNDPALVDVRLFAQFFWAGPTAPPLCPPLGVSASNALDITIQR